MAFVLCVIIIISAAPTVFAATNDFSMIDDILVIDDVFIEFGNTSSTLTLDPFGYGPCSFAIKNNKIYVLDTQANAIKVYNFAGTYLNSFSYPEYLYAIDMEVCGNDLYIMCDNNMIYSANMDNVEIEWLEVCEYSLEDVACLMYDSGVIYARMFEGADIVLGSDSTTSISTAAIAQLTDRATSLAAVTDSGMSIDRDGVEYKIALHGTPVGTYFLKSTNGASYIMEQEALLKLGYVEMRVGKYMNGNKVATALLTSVADYESCIPYKKIYITEGGDLYQMISTDSGMKIVNVPWEGGEQTAITAAMVAANSYATNSVDNSLSTYSASRRSALARAAAMCNYTWTYIYSEHHTPTTDTTSSPEQLGTTDGTQTGIPYSIGGMNGIDNSFISGTVYYFQVNFIDGLNNGWTAGNVAQVGSCQYGTVGVDCSGFVCNAYKIATKLGCSQLMNPTYTTSITWAEIQAGDLGINTEHVFMIKSILGLSSGQFSKVETYESTKEGTGDKAKSMIRLYADVISSYGAYVVN